MKIKKQANLQNSIERLIEEYNIPIERTSGDKKICFCPFHDDKNTPNLTIYPLTNSWFCYGCNIGGGPVEFLMEMEGITKEEAKRRIYPQSDTNILRLKFDHMKDRTDNVSNLDLRDEINFALSKRCYEFLKDNQDRGKEVFDILSWLDKELGSEITESTSKVVMDEFNNRLERIS